MGRAPGLFDLDERLALLSQKGDALERLAEVVDFEVFRTELERAVPRADRAKGGRPPFDHVLMFKVLILQTQNNLSDERTEFYLRDRLTWMRFLGLGLADPVPDANTIWTFREALTRTGAIARLFALFDQALRAAGYLAMSGQLVDARWTIKYTKAKPDQDGKTPPVDIAIPAFGYQNHIGADRRHRLIRTWRVTSAAAHAGARLADLLDPANTASGVWADSAYRSKRNEALLKERMLVSRIHCKKPAKRPMPARIARANAKRSAVRAHVEHV